MPKASKWKPAWCGYLRVFAESAKKGPFLSISGRFHFVVNTRWMWYESCLFVIGPWLANEQKELFDLFLIHEKSHPRNSSESEIARVRDWESALFPRSTKPVISERFLPILFLSFYRLTRKKILDIWRQKFEPSRDRSKAIRRMPGNIMEEKILNVF